MPDSITRLYNLNGKATVSRYTEDYLTESGEVARYEVVTTRTVTLVPVNHAAHVATANTWELQPAEVREPRKGNPPAPMHGYSS